MSLSKFFSRNSQSPSVDHGCADFGWCIIHILYPNAIFGDPFYTFCNLPYIIFEFPFEWGAPVWQGSVVPSSDIESVKVFEQKWPVGRADFGWCVIWFDQVVGFRLDFLWVN